MDKIQKATERTWLFSTLIIVFVALAFISLWAIDISVSALLIGQATVQPMFLTNGFWNTDPTQLYHAGLWMLTLSVISLAVICGYLLLVNFSKKIIDETKGG